MTVSTAHQPETEEDRPAWARRPAPGRLALVQQFLNTHAYPGHDDDFACAATAQTWLRQHIPAAQIAPDADPADYRRLRDRLRDYVRGPSTLADSTRLTRTLGHPPLTVDMSATGDITLVSAGSATEWLSGEIAAALVLAVADGSWRRFKTCANDECQAIFWDQTKNGSGRFCTPEICGNRFRQRHFRATHPQAKTAGDTPSFRGA
ncbi:CGNR zinc finger domain-containing protein [Nocardia sp. NPDC051570]|uniref:CGNR zinc finger domain-containing protein n=1 Tax=Nocardia sp. NPDC051570 TaxID=3364324 RepID=UPI003787AD98